jgi:hypothetical protein
MFINILKTLQTTDKNECNDRIYITCNDLPWHPEDICLKIPQFLDPLYIMFEKIGERNNLLPSFNSQSYS